MSSSSYTTSDPFPIGPIEIVLGHLDRVKRSGPNRWQARCPAHEDRTPSLSVTEREDGSVRLKCFAGCDWLDIAAAIGLTGAQLYPDANGYFRPAPKGRATIRHLGPRELRRDWPDLHRALFGGRHRRVE